MGAAESSNVAEAVTTVSTSVNQNTTANASQVQQINQQWTNNGCDIKVGGNFTVKDVAGESVKNTQIITAKQDANVKNNIQQLMAQEAASKVGFLGIGYASAHNSASTFCNSSTAITQAMSAAAEQFTSVNQSWTCNNGYIDIGGNYDVEFTSNGSYLSEQTLSNTQVATVVNDITQSIKQKASATVEGVGSLLFLLLLGIAMVIYALGKPLASGSGKMAITIGAMFGITILITFMYVRKTPPLFAEPQECVKGSAIGKSKDDNSQCINLQTKDLPLSAPPLKYQFPLLPGGQCSGDVCGNMLQMAIAGMASSISGQAGLYGDNAGYRIDVMQLWDSSIMTGDQVQQAIAAIGVTAPPNPLYNPGGASPYFTIPKQYQQIAGSGTGDDQPGKCTPGSIAVDTVSGPDDLTGACQGANATFKPNDASGNSTQDPRKGTANLNVAAWSTYLSTNGSAPTDTKANRILFTRWLLYKIVSGNDQQAGNVYVDENEIVQGPNWIDIAKNRPKDAYQFKPSTSYDILHGFNSAGTLAGEVGVWNTRMYQFQQFMRKIGIWILLVIFVGAFGTIMFKHARAGKVTSPTASPPKISKK